MAPTSQLLGPPELLHHQPPPPPEPRPSPPSGDPFIDLMVSDFNKTKPKADPPRGRTENDSPTFASTDNPCLDFFFHIVPSTPSNRLTDLLKSAWKHDDATTFKLICHLRGGKRNKEGFYNAALWLHKYHPKTLACNVKVMVEFGFFEDLVQILYRILEGSNDTRKPQRFPSLGDNLDDSDDSGSSSDSESDDYDWAGRRRIRKSTDTKKSTNTKKKEENPSEVRKEKELAKARKAVERYARDPDYRFLHDQISQTFADYLISDMESLKTGETCKTSLASKWCPSLDSPYDKATLLCENIAKRVFPRESYPEYQGIEDVHYAYRVRDRLRKEVLVPLRQALELPEVYMTAGKWNTLPYGSVDAAAMANYKGKFLEHDETRFKEFLAKVERGESKIAAEELLPHQIVSRLDGGLVEELQWKRMVNDLTTKGKLKGCLAVLDVSRSMKGAQMEAGIALGLLVSELSERPWNDKIITFTENPQLHVIEGDDLQSKVEFLKNIERLQKKDYGQNLQKVFNKILKVAAAGSLGKEQMIKRVFVFSDMEFSSGRGTNRTGIDTDYEAIKRDFEAHGYTVPEIVFWNLRDSKATPVPCDQKGVALVSGFSKDLMGLFLGEEEIGVKSPMAVMETAILGREYEQLVVLD